MVKNARKNLSSKYNQKLLKHAYVRMCILDLSKLLMYEFRYDYFKKKNSRLLFTYIDSLMYEIKTEDVYEDFSKDTEIFQFKKFSIQLSQNIS